MSSFFVRRPIVAIVISIVMVIVGAIALKGLPIAQYPEITPPLIQITTTFTGALPICDESFASRAFTAGSSTATKSHIW